MTERFDREATLALKAGLACARRQGAVEMGGEHLLVGITAVPSRVASTWPPYSASSGIGWPSAGEPVDPDSVRMPGRPSRRAWKSGRRARDASEWSTWSSDCSAHR